MRRPYRRSDDQKLKKNETKTEIVFFFHLLVHIQSLASSSSFLASFVIRSTRRSPFISYVIFVCRNASHIKMGSKTKNSFRSSFVFETNGQWTVPNFTDHQLFILFRSWNSILIQVFWKCIRPLCINGRTGCSGAMQSKRLRNSLKCCNGNRTAAIRCWTLAAAAAMWPSIIFCPFCRWISRVSLASIYPSRWYDTRANTTHMRTFRLTKWTLGPIWVNTCARPSHSITSRRSIACIGCKIRRKPFRIFTICSNRKATVCSSSSHRIPFSRCTNDCRNQRNGRSIWRTSIGSYRRINMRKMRPRILDRCCTQAVSPTTAWKSERNCSFTRASSCWKVCAFFGFIHTFFFRHHLAPR